MLVDRRHWVLAFCGALAVHLAVAMWVMWQPPSTGAVNAGLGGVEVNLGTSAAPSADELAEALPETVASEDATADEPGAEAGTQIAEEVPVAEEATPGEAPRMPAPATLEVEATEVAEAEPTEAMEAVELVEPVEERRTAPKPVPKPERPVVRKEPPKPRPEPVRQAEPKPRQPDRPQLQPPAAVAASPSPSPAAEAGRAQTSTASSTQPAGSSDPRGAAASPAEAGGGGMPGAPADYLALLRSWLERHKEYPRRAQLRRQEGTALLYFAMDRDGRVLDYRLRKSSGYPVLDGEIEAMIRRAQPLPAAPSGFGGSRLEFVIPVQFSLR